MKHHGLHAQGVRKERARRAQGVRKEGAGGAQGGRRGCAGSAQGVYTPCIISDEHDHLAIRGGSRKFWTRKNNFIVFR